jgi:hypothetical protein
MKKMMKKTVVLLTVFVLAVGPLKAQVFIADDEFEGMMRRSDPDFVLVAPMQGMTTDQFTPIGNGVLLLAGLGGAYLLRKCKKKE